MKQQEPSGSPCVAAYAQVGSIQQMFRSNAKMAQHLFKELLEDGNEHSAKEINNYIFGKTGGCGVDGGRLTDETIHSAIWYMFRHGHDIGYMQTRKGYYQKSTAEVLMGDGPRGLKAVAEQVLAEAREKIRQLTAAPALPEPEQQKLAPLRESILRKLDRAMRDIRECNPNEMDASPEEAGITLI